MVRLPCSWYDSYIVAVPVVILNKIMIEIR